MTISRRKWERVVARLLEGPLHRFEAEKYPVSDHCLPSTISELQSRRGLVIHAESIELSGYSGLGARVALYRLDDNSRDRALRLLSGAGVPPRLAVIESHGGDKGDTRART